ncbi:MarR family winged helix-turn-helix transcriptional regulator [Vibrio sp. LaRot3]|uniref:MarR family winged helix-turn-helix transcriptional regulator n=1 Tax=Vibrio sp. LaRot3 TaxID=2998829 RepID=UPI0022CDE6F0|nr:MarR family transcriptional regulator [Vibrio sp. LaRot3]MDA0150482.1 MarR family transcriptional regulator [Vibrio sp. LaRot3]
MSEKQKVLGNLAFASFALNGRVLELAESIASHGGITATRWQVLGAVLEQPLTQTAIAHRMGISRQSVQRTANQLVKDGLLQAIDNPLHRKASLFEVTAKGLEAIDKIRPHHAMVAGKLLESISEEKLEKITELMNELSIEIGKITHGER